MFPAELTAQALARTTGIGGRVADNTHAGNLAALAQ